VILWDFDGTLARRSGGTSFGACIVETLDEHEPDHGSTLVSFGRSFVPVSLAHARASPPAPVDDSELVGARRASSGARLRGVGSSQYEREHSGSSQANAMSMFGIGRSSIHSPGAVDSSRSRLEPRDLVEPCAGTARDRQRSWPAVFLRGLDQFSGDRLRKPNPEAFAIARRAAGDPSTLWMVEITDCRHCGCRSRRYPRDSGSCRAKPGSPRQTPRLNAK